MGKHAPIPWEIQKTKYEGEFIINATEQIKSVASVGTQANAEFIVRACNSHYDLLEVCKEVRKHLSGVLTDEQAKTRRQLEQAIAKAERK